MTLTDEERAEGTISFHPARCCARLCSSTAPSAPFATRPMFLIGLHCAEFPQLGSAWYARTQVQHPLASRVGAPCWPFNRSFCADSTLL